MWGALTADTPTPQLELDFLGCDTTATVLAYAVTGSEDGIIEQSEASAAAAAIVSAGAGTGGKKDCPAAKVVSDARAHEVRMLTDGDAEYL